MLRPACCTFALALTCVQSRVRVCMLALDNLSTSQWELFLRRFGPFEVCLHKALDSVFDADAASATGRAVLPWFHGATERAATERVLRSASAGHFLVRWSATFPDAFLLVYVRRGGGPRLKHRLLYNHAGHGYAEEPRLSGAVKVYPSIAGYVASQRHVLTHAIYSGLYYECQRELTLPQLPRAVDRARLFNQPLPGPGRYAAAPTYATAGASFGAPQTTAVALGPPPAAKMHNRRNGRIPSAPQSARSVSADSWASTPPAYVVATSPAAVAPPPPAYPLDVAGTRMAVPVHDGVPSARALAAPVSDAPPPSYAEAAGLASAAPVGGDATGLQDSSAGRGGGGPE